MWNKNKKNKVKNKLKYNNNKTKLHSKSNQI